MLAPTTEMAIGGGHRVDHLKLLDGVKKKVRENFERKRKGAA